MQQEWDDLDRLIADSNVDIEPSAGYNYKLMSRIKEKKQTGRQTRITALSLIMAGFLMMFIYTSDIQAALISIECRMKTDIVTIKQGFDLGRYFIGE